jgi:sugar lactone lactonase YvrE
VDTSSGNVFVADTGNNLIQKFDCSLNFFVTQFGSFGSRNGQFDGSSGAAVDSSANVFVSDLVNDRVQKFALDP